MNNRNENALHDRTCLCPLAEIEYMIGIDNLEAVNIKTGRCLRCNGTRLNKLGIVLKGKRRINKEVPIVTAKIEIEPAKIKEVKKTFKKNKELII